MAVTAVTPLTDSAKAVTSVGHHLSPAAKAFKFLALQVELPGIKGFFIHP